MSCLIFYDYSNMLSFLHGVLQVYLEYWNSSYPFEEYVPDLTKSSRCVQDKCAHMITEIVSLLKHIRNCQYLPNINMVEKMDNLQKLNTDLIATLDEYFSTNIWIPDLLENKKYMYCSLSHMSNKSDRPLIKIAL